jgi:hypothetical protein
MPLRLLVILILLVNHALAAWAPAATLGGKCEPRVAAGVTTGCCCGDAGECPCAAESPASDLPEESPTPAGRATLPGDLFPVSGGAALPSWSLTGLESPTRRIRETPERGVATRVALSVLCVWQT